MEAHYCGKPLATEPKWKTRLTSQHAGEHDPKPVSSTYLAHPHSLCWSSKLQFSKGFPIKIL